MVMFCVLSIMSEFSYSWKFCIHPVLLITTWEFSRSFLFPIFRVMLYTPGLGVIHTTLHIHTGFPWGFKCHLTADWRGVKIRIVRSVERMEEESISWGNKWGKKYHDIEWYKNRRMKSDELMACTPSQTSYPKGIWSLSQHVNAVWLQ